MRLFIGDPKTGRFTKMIEVYVVDPCSSNECVLYVQDPWGSFYTLTFPDRNMLTKAMTELRNTGCGTAFCYLDYCNREIQNTDEQDRELDPNLYRETLDVWGYDYER